MNKEPAYAKYFACLAGSCPDSCCKDWEIVIDPETEEKYRDLKDETGRQLREYMVKDEDGDTIFRNIDSHCPWWNSEGLCELRILKGQEMTSLICRLHPLIIEEYESFTEQMLSLSCPAAYDLIVTSPVKNTYPVITEQADDEVLNLLVSCRNEWLTNMDEEHSAAENMELLYQIGARIQRQINESEEISNPVPEYYQLPHGIDLCNMIFPAMKTDMEVTTGRFRNILDHAPDTFTQVQVSLLNQILAYFVCRYVLKAVNDCDLIHHLQFIEFSLYLPMLLSSSLQYSLPEMYRLYSREVEHNTSNTSLIYETICSLNN